MGLAKKPTSQSRVNFLHSLSKWEIRKLVANKNLKVLQTDRPVEDKTWQLINDRLLTKRPEIEIRVYAHYGTTCDLSFIPELSNVTNLSLDCLMKANGAEKIASLKKLKSLSIGIYNLQSFDFLNLLPPSLSHLFLGSTTSKKPDLKALENFTSLKTLYIEGQQKHIEVLSTLKNLEKLTLRSVSPKDISFLRQMNSLWSLDIKLGGIRDLSPLENLTHLKYLELWQIQGLSDISVVSTLTGLQYLFLQSLRNVSSLPDMSKLIKLRRVYLETMKGLKDVSGLFKAPALEEFIHVSAQNMQPSQYEDLLKMPLLKRASFGFGSTKKNQDFENKLKDSNIDKYQHHEFIFH